MNRQDLERAVYRDFGYADSPASAIANRVRGYLNDRHRRLCSLPGAEMLRRETGPAVTLTASTATYALDMPIQKVLHIVDTTHDEMLRPRTLDWYRRIDPDPTTGTQEYWIPMRWSPALADIGGTGLWIVSSAGSDGMETSVETIDTNGSYTQTNAVINGSTRVQVGSATNHQRVIRFSLASAAVGVISLYNASSNGTEVSNVQLGRTDARFLVIALWPTPSATDSISVDYTRFIRDFTADYDEPQLPPDFHYLVSLGAKIDEGRKKEDLNRVGQWDREWRLGSATLIDFLANHAETIIVPGGLRDTGRSNLGSAYPSGLW